MEQEIVRSGLGRKAILPVLLGGRPTGKQDMLCMYSADRQTRAKGRPMTTRMVEGTEHPHDHVCMYGIYRHVYIYFESTNGNLQNNQEIYVKKTYVCTESTQLCLCH